MGLVATLLPSQLRLNRLRTALRERSTLVTCNSWSELLAACASQPVTTAVVDIVAPPGTAAAFDHLRHLKRRYPSVTVVLYAAIPPARPRDLFEAGRFGFDGLALCDEEDDPHQLRALIEQAEARAVLGELRLALRDAKPTVRDATLVSIIRAHQHLSPLELARILGIRRKALAERLSASGFPPTQRLIAWCRLIVASRLLEDPGRSADSVALALDYPSGSAFRNSCQRYLHATPNEIRSRGGARFAIAEFLREAGMVREGDAANAQVAPANGAAPENGADGDAPDARRRLNSLPYSVSHNGSSETAGPDADDQQERVAGIPW
ncbi:MAG TPA: helix-turn-helix domain-containing protein [Gemmatimonadaceae bacterium]|nr:helix-turn-helix domain-containing protein [Gemmatimonadaceae bacterium]